MSTVADPFDSMLAEISACDTISGRLAASIVRFAFHVGSPRPADAPAPRTAVAAAEEVVPRRSGPRSPRKAYVMTEAHKAKIAAGRLKKQSAAAASTFPATAGDDGGAVFGVAAEPMPRDREGDHRTDDAGDREVGVEAGNGLGQYRND